MGLFQYFPIASRAHDLDLRKPNKTTERVWAFSNIFPLHLEHMILIYGSQIRRQMRVWAFSNIFPLRLEHMILLYGSLIRRQIVSVGLFQHIYFVSRAQDKTKKKSVGLFQYIPSVSRAHDKTTGKKHETLSINFLWVASTRSCSTEGQIRRQKRNCAWASSNIFPLCLEHMIRRQ